MLCLELIVSQSVVSPIAHSAAIISHGGMQHSGQYFISVFTTKRMHCWDEIYYKLGKPNWDFKFSLWQGIKSFHQNFLQQLSPTASSGIVVSNYTCKRILWNTQEMLGDIYIYIERDKDRDRERKRYIKSAMIAS